MARIWANKGQFSKILVVGAGLFAAGTLPYALGAQQAPPPPQPPAGSVGGVGDVNLFPKRVVLDNRVRIASIGLYNKTVNPGDYDITVTDKVMTEEGQVLDPTSIEDPALKARHKSAVALLRWSPRKVALRGSEAQTVRIMARIPPDLAPGEYRAHFSAISIPRTNEAGITLNQAPQANQPNSIGVQIVPRFGISIPVILRVGQTTLTVGLQDLGLTRQPDGTQAFTLTIARSGTRSAFGNIILTAPGFKKPLAEIKGIGVYPEIDRRKVTIPVDPTVAVAPVAPGTRVTVTYIDDDFAPGQTLAKQEFTVR